MQQPVDGAVLSNCEYFSVGALHYSTGDIPRHAGSEVGLYSKLWIVVSYLTVETFHWVHLAYSPGGGYTS